MVVMSANTKFNYLFIILNSTATADTISPVIQYSSSLMHLVCDPILDRLVPERLAATECSEDSKYTQAAHVSFLRWL
jgi:hypothetical protein